MLFQERMKYLSRIDSLSKLKKFWNFILFLFCFSFANAQPHSIILGRPTDKSVTASILFEKAAQFYVQFGTSSGKYSGKTPVYTNTIHSPDEIDLSDLLPNTRYYYRVRYGSIGSEVFDATPEYTFHTQRATGSSFTFTIESDEHLYDKKGVKNMYQVTLNNQAADHPDFMISLGDIFGDDHNPFSITSAEVDSLHKDYRPFLGSICHSIPFYVCLGNHEGENDYYYSFNKPDNLCIWGTKSRKFYYPNPFPNEFYSGNQTEEPFGVGSPENYYAWKWGDALFIVLDVYREQCRDSLVAKPQGWNWTLGLPQYTWLKNTLEKSTETYKFVFAHHIRGQGRGGIAMATTNEWGGYQNTNGSNYTFPANRPGWAKPIHKLFVDNGVNIFFQGHDHVFAHEVLDNVTYQSVPMAADSTYEIGMLANADAYVSDTVDGTGHIRVNVSPACVQVDYVKAYLPADTLSGLHHNREIGFSYTIGNCSSSGNTKIEKTDFVSVFPNPAKNKINLNFIGPERPHQSRLINHLGQIVVQTPENEIDVSEIDSGIYFLIIESEDLQCIKKVLVQH